MVQKWEGDPHSTRPTLPGDNKQLLWGSEQSGHPKGRVA